MRLPRVVQRLLDTTQWRTDRARWASLAAVVWGLMLFPGGYSERPMIDPPPGRHLAGTFIVEEAGAGPTGMGMRVFGGGMMHWSAGRPHHWWSGYYPEDTPWFLHWTVRPTLGGWYVVPDHRQRWRSW